MLLADGCGGDDSTNGGPGPTSDAAAQDSVQPPLDGPTADTMPADAGSVTVVAPDVTVYVSQPARLDASQTQGPSPSDAVTFAWLVTTVPAGSAVTTQSLQNPATQAPSFVPDVAGDYALRLTATSGGATATQVVTVHAKNGFVFYTTTKADNVTPYFEFDVVQMDGTGTHAVACRQRTFALPPNSQDAGSIDFSDGGAADSGIGAQFLALSAYSADFNLDTWEGPAGTSGRSAFQAATGEDDSGTFLFSLLAATSDNTCQNPPTPVHAVTGSQPSIFSPRFSPDGKRIAYVEQRDQSDIHIATVGFDGTDYHDFGNICGLDGGSDCSGTAVPGVRPQWSDATHIGWVIQTNGSTTPATWSVLAAPDTNSAVVSTYMTCSGASLPRSFAFLPDGSVVANFMATSGGVEDLVVFGKDGAGKCLPTRNLTNLVSPGSYARDFAVSPDGSMIAYIQFTAPSGFDASNLFLVGGGLYLVPVDGSAAPHPVGGAKELYAFFGARWIAGGNRLAWNGTVADPDASFGDLDASFLYIDGGVPAMNVIPVDGSTVTVVAKSDPANELYVFGGGNGGGCSFQLMLCSSSSTRSGSTQGALALTGLLGGVFFWRRRERKRK
jgi:MYXO-CTERM domain-containing protein